ncbi:MAG: hypothetical protein ABFD50_13365 [Smithella sp.]
MATKKINFAYQALTLMSRLFYKKFGDDAIPIIRDVWYQMGLASGKILKKKLGEFDFRSAADFLDNRNKQSSEFVVCQLSDELYHFNTLPGSCCDLGLDDAGRPVCEAVMSINQGQFKSICGFDVKMDIVKSRAAGDDCCEVKYCPVNVLKRE